MDKRPKSIGNIFSNRSGTSKKKQQSQNHAHYYNSNSVIPRLNSKEQHQQQRSMYVATVTQADIHRDYNTYQNNQNNQNIPNNNLYNINNEPLQQYNNTIPRPSTAQLHQYSKLPTILQSKPLISPAIAYHPEVNALRKENDCSLPRLNSKDQHQQQRSTYVATVNQADIYGEYNTYQNNQNNQSIPNNILYNINDEQLEQYNTIPQPSTTAQLQQNSKLPIILQLYSLKKENDQLKLIITQKDDKIHDLESEVTILKDQNVQFQKIYKHLQNFDENQSSKGGFAISKLFLQMKLMKQPSKDDLKKKKILQNELVFDNELERIPQHEFIKGIPKIVVDCILALESNLFMKTNGLYRVSGNYAAVQKLQFDIDNNKYNKIHDQKDPHNIANVLKLFLRELKTPLISHNQLQEGIPSLNAFNDDTIDAKICKIKKLFHSLPDINRETLKYLIKHLGKVADIRENNMGSEHLAIIFGVYIFNNMTNTLNSKDDMDLFLNSMAIPNLCVRLMIENYEEIFEKKYLGMDDDNADDDDHDGTDDDEVDHFDNRFGTLV